MHLPTLLSTTAILAASYVSFAAARNLPEDGPCYRLFGSIKHTSASTSDVKFFIDKRPRRDTPVNQAVKYCDYERTTLKWTRSNDFWAFDQQVDCDGGATRFQLGKDGKLGIVRRNGRPAVGHAMLYINNYADVTPDRGGGFLGEQCFVGG